MYNQSFDLRKDFGYDAVVVLSQASSIKELPVDAFNSINKISNLAPVYFFRSYDQKRNETFLTKVEDNIYVVNPNSENLSFSMEKLLRTVKRRGGRNILLLVSSPIYSEILPFITMSHVAIYLAMPDSMNVSDDLRRTINLCSAVICPPDSAEKIKSDPAIVPPVWPLPRAIEKEGAFDQILDQLSVLKAKVPFSRKFKKRVLVIYSRNSCHIGTVREHLDAFSLFSRHEITFMNGIGRQFISQEFMDSFDVVIIHYSVRISDPGHLSPHFYECLKTYKGFKVLFIQDEYDNVKSTHQYMQNIDFDALYTTINEGHCYKLYPKDLFPHLQLIQNFTGYVPYKLGAFVAPRISQRKIDVFYRGRELPYQYGTLGVEKYEIGTKFLESCQEHGLTLNTDIHSADDKRIYGDGWYKALSQSKTMLGTESGSNVFDLEGDLMALIEQDKAEGLSYDEIYERRLKKSEEEWKINTISPKVFEAMMLGTVLVLYEGEYSGVIEPGRHYISLKKDFSNIAEVVAAIKDDRMLENIAKQAFEEVVCNYKYSYEWLIRDNLDPLIDEEVLILRRGSIIPDAKYEIAGKNREKRFDENKYFDAYVPPSLLSTDAELIYDAQVKNKPIRQKLWEFAGRVENKIHRMRGIK